MLHYQFELAHAWVATLKMNSGAAAWQETYVQNLLFLYLKPIILTIYLINSCSYSIPTTSIDLYSDSPTYWTHLPFGQEEAWRQEDPALNLKGLRYIPSRFSANLLKTGIFFNLALYPSLNDLLYPTRPYSTYAYLYLNYYHYTLVIQAGESKSRCG